MKMDYKKQDEARVTVTADKRFTMDGKEIRSLADMRKHFTPADVWSVSPYLEDWLNDHFYEGEAEAVSDVCQDTPEHYTENICRILGVETPLSKEEEEEMKRRTEILRQYTEDPVILKNIRKVAFDQQDLADLIRKGETVIYLFHNDFTIPLSKPNIRYIGIADPVIENPHGAEEYRKAGIRMENVVLSEEEKDAEGTLLREIRKTMDGLFANIAKDGETAAADEDDEYDEDEYDEDEYDEYEDDDDDDDDEEKNSILPSTLPEVVHMRLSAKRTLKYISFSRSDCLDCRGFHSRHECRKAGETIIRNAYKEASHCLSPNNADSLARSEAEKYGNEIGKALRTIMGPLEQFCRARNQVEIYRQISDAVSNCNKKLLAAFTEELEENSDYYSLYDLDYFLGQLEIEEHDMRSETGLLGMLEWLNPDSFEYSFDGAFEALEEIEKDINAKASTFFSVTHERFRDYARNIEDLIESACADLPPMKRNEAITTYLNRCAPRR